MALPSTAELSLIDWLASRTRAQWSTLANLRGLTPNYSRGLTTAARRLQEPDNVAAALGDMRREDLLVLRRVGNSHPLSGDVCPLELRGLVDTREESPQLLCEHTYLEILEEIDASASAPEHPPAPELSAGESVAAATAKQRELRLPLAGEAVHRWRQVTVDTKVNENMVCPSRNMSFPKRNMSFPKRNMSFPK